MKVPFYELLCTTNRVLYDNLYLKCLKKILWAFEKDLAGKKMPSGTRLGTTALRLVVQWKPLNVITTPTIPRLKLIRLLVPIS
jgi:hypothetical protein